VKYYFVETLGSSDSGSNCILDNIPVGLGLAGYMPAKGERVGSEYPEDAKIYMDDEHPGIRIGSLIGNTNSYLIVATAVKEIIAVQCANVDIEYLSFTLYNHKKREHSKDYWIINSIGTRDCLNLDLSEIEYFNEPGDPYDGAVVSVDRFVLDPAKLKDAPALFRIKEEPREYVINETLAKIFQEQGFTNIRLTEIEQQPVSGKKP
jgi:hypothetical protein